MSEEMRARLVERMREIGGPQVFSNVWVTFEALFRVLCEVIELTNDRMDRLIELTERSQILMERLLAERRTRN